MMYLLFAGSSYYEKGKDNGLVRSFSERGEAMNVAKAIIGFDGLYDYSDVNWCIVIASNGKPVYSLGECHPSLVHSLRLSVNQE